MTGSRLRLGSPLVLFNLAILLLGALVPAGFASAAAPVFSGMIPDLAVDAGGENLNAYDFAAHFSDPDGQSLLYQVMSSYGSFSLPFRNPYPTTGSWGLYIAINGTHVELRVTNTSAWGHGAIIKIRASDGTGSVDSNEFKVYISAPPVTGRTWVLLDGDNAGFGLGNRLSEGCFQSFTLYTMGHPTDGITAEWSFVASRRPVDPPTGGFNGTAPPPDVYASAVNMTIASDGVELLNASVTEYPTRLFLNATAVNERWENATPHFGLASIIINMTICTEGGVAWLNTGEAREWFLRFPPGDDRSNLNPNAPTFSGTFADLNYTAAFNASISLWSYFDYPDMNPTSEPFDDADGDPLSLQANPANPTDFAPSGILIWFDNGNFNISVTDGAASGSYEFNLSARDPFGATAYSNQFFINITGQEGLPAVPQFTTITIDGASGSLVTAGEPSTFALLPEPPPGVQVLWFLDGVQVGQGRALSSFVVPEGNHTLEVRASNGVVHRSLDLLLHSSPAPSGPTSPEVQVAPWGGFSPAAAVVVVFVVAAGVALGTLEFSRYAILGALAGAIASRTKRPSLLDHFVRGQIYQIIKENPGIHFMEILRRSELANGTASHHLRVLEKGGLVRVVVDGTKTRFYITGEKPDPADYGLSPADRKVLDAVFETPGVEQLQVAKRLGFSRSRVNRSVSRLTLLGFVLKSRDGKSTLLYPRAEGAADFADVRPFADPSE